MAKMDNYFEANKYPVLAWMRQAEIKSDKYELNTEYSKEKLKKNYSNNQKSNNRK